MQNSAKAYTNIPIIQDNEDDSAEKETKEM